MKNYRYGHTLIIGYWFIYSSILFSIGTTCLVAAPLQGQIVVDNENPAWLRYYGNGPHFMAGAGDPEDFLYRGLLNSDGTRNGDQQSIIDKLKSSGANSIYFQVVRSHGGDGQSTHNPFLGNDPSNGINAAILDQWETWFTELDKNGIVMYFFFYDDSARVWNTGDSVGHAERSFIHTLVSRFKHHKYLIWVVAEEYGEAYSSTRVSNIAAEINAADNYDHVTAVHKNVGLSFSEFADDPNIHQFAIQYSASTPSQLHDAVVTAWRNAAGKYNNNMSEAAGWGTGKTARKKAWAVAMGGAYVMVLGMDVISTPTSDLEDLGRLVQFMESTNFNEMAPLDELAFAGTEYVLALPETSYIAYASNLSGNKIGLRDMTPGQYRLVWFDVTNGASVVQDNVHVTGGDTEWAKPQNIGNELAVFIRRLEGPVMGRG